MNLDNLSNDKLNSLIEEKRAELNRLFGEQGLNDFTLGKSQELDVLVVKAQMRKLQEDKEKGIIIA